MKTLSYVYPTSPIALAAGHYKTGCHVLVTDGEGTQTFLSSRDALEAFDESNEFTSTWSFFGGLDSQSDERRKRYENNL